MKESMWGYWLVVLGIGIMAVMILLQNYTTTNEQDYYMLKNVLEAAMNDAVDYAYYRETGKMKMNAEKFTENFIRRFSETTNINKTYKIDFYNIYEEPPAASIAVTTNSDKSNFGENGTAATDDINITSRLTGILYTDSLYTPRNNN